MRRREFIGIAAGGAAWPLVTRAQQKAMPVIGVLDSGSAAEFGPGAAAFREGLREAGFIEGRNITIETPLGRGAL